MNAKFTEMILNGISQEPEFITRLAFLIPELGDERTLMKLAEGVRTHIESVDLKGLNADEKLLKDLKGSDMNNYRVTEISYYNTDEVRMSYEFDRTRWFNDPENAKKYEKDGETWNRDSRESMDETHTFSATHHFSSSTTKNAEKFEKYVIFDIL